MDFRLSSLPVPIDAVEHEVFRMGRVVARVFKWRSFKVLLGRDPRHEGDELQWHMSISHPTRYPKWDEIKEARYKFCPDEVTMGMLLPPKADYVNHHPNCFHLWEVKDD